MTSNNVVAVTKRNAGISDDELLWRVELIRRLESQREELDAQIESLKDEIKAEMTERGVEKLTVGTHRVSWASYTTHRLDAKALKAENESIYERYSKAVTTRRFVIS